MTAEDEATLRLDCAAEEGLLNGDLKPLAMLLRSGGELSEEVRSLLADAIEGNVPFRPLRLTHRSGWIPESRKSSQHDQRLLIGAYIHLRSLRAAPGQWESIVAEAAEEFRVSVASAAKALGKFRSWRELQDEGDLWVCAVLNRAWRRAFPEEYQAFLDSLPE